MGALHLHFPSVAAVETGHPNFFSSDIPGDKSNASRQCSADHCFSDAEPFFIG